MIVLWRKISKQVFNQDRFREDFSLVFHFVSDLCIRFSWKQPICGKFSSFFSLFLSFRFRWPCAKIKIKIKRNNNKNKNKNKWKFEDKRSSWFSSPLKIVQPYSTSCYIDRWENLTRILYPSFFLIAVLYSTDEFDLWLIILFVTRRDKKRLILLLLFEKRQKTKEKVDWRNSWCHETIKNIRNRNKSKQNVVKCE